MIYEDDSLEKFVIRSGSWVMFLVSYRRIILSDLWSMPPITEKCWSFWFQFFLVLEILEWDHFLELWENLKV